MSLDEAFTENDLELFLAFDENDFDEIPIFCQLSSEVDHNNG